MGPCKPPSPGKKGTEWGFGYVAGMPLEGTIDHRKYGILAGETTLATAESRRESFGWQKNLHHLPHHLLLPLPISSAASKNSSSSRNSSPHSKILKIGDEPTTEPIKPDTIIIRVDEDIVYIAEEHEEKAEWQMKKLEECFRVVMEIDEGYLIISDGKETNRV